ncbi:type VII secretion target [Streptomyces bicolor]|uniref:type VII secretion target n=1 Tax=Streptomyces bicolor TaxID=66874 RepID=UPI000997B4B7|nr:type VII secretion target [Streptomyces bicolor]
MAGNLTVSPNELRGSAGAADGIADDMKEPSDKAVKEAATAGSTMTGWSIGPALQEISSSWGKALKGLHDRTKAGATNLRKSADGHEWNDDLVSQDFEKLGLQTASARGVGVGVMSAPMAGGGAVGSGPYPNTGLDPRFPGSVGGDVRPLGPHPVDNGITPFDRGFQPPVARDPGFASPFPGENIQGGPHLLPDGQRTPIDESPTHQFPEPDSTDLPAPGEQRPAGPTVGQEGSTPGEPEIGTRPTPGANPFG